MKEKNYPYFLDAYQDVTMGTPGTFPLRRSDIERLAKQYGIGDKGAKVDPQQTEVTFTENGVNVIEPLQGFDGMSSVKVTVDVAGGGGGDYSKWEIGDIVLYDNIENKKVKSTRGDYNLDKFPADRFTPIGVIAFVMEDGSARMLALAAMNTNTPDTGSDTNQSIYWGGNNVDITGLTDYTKAATIDHETGEVIEADGSPCVPSTSDQFGGALSLDGERCYVAESGAFLPSPYNADGTLNSEFTVSSLTVGPLYCWSREKDGSTYYMYTDTETPSEETILWCGTLGNNSQVKNYGNTSKIDGSRYAATRLGSILDESVFDGGVEVFTSEFTSVADSTYEETILFANSDMDGKSNCEKILLHQTDYIYDKEQDGENRYYWYRMNESDGNRYFLYTNDDEENLSVDTKIYIQGKSSESFVKDYGTINQYNGTSWYEIGTIGNESYITGGVEGFVSKFTRVSQEEWRTATSLQNNYNTGNYPIATTTWRFHTVGTEQGDWYCPAAGELAMMISNFGDIQSTLKLIKKTAQIPVACLGAYSFYWSSSEVSFSSAWCYNFNYGGLDNSNDKGSRYCVRALCVLSALD